jgi:hypothetical protein
MAKLNPLVQGLESQPLRATTRKPAKQATAASASPAKPTPPSREGRVLVGGHFAPEVQTALKIIAAEERTTVQALLSEAINTIFAKRHRPEIAGISAS